MMIEFDEYKVKLNGLKPKLDELAASLGIERCKEDIERLHAQIESPGFWDNAEVSQKVMKQARQVEAKVERYEKMCSHWEDLMTICEMALEEDDDSIQALADQLDDVSDSLAMLEDYVYSEEFPDIEDEYDDEEDDAEEALQALEEDGFFELECPNCDDTLVVDKSVLDSGRVVCPGCGQEFEIELGYEDAEDDSDEE